MTSCPSSEESEAVHGSVSAEKTQQVPKIWPPARILFGSCNSQDHDQPLWERIRARNATAFVWAGDAVYGDDRFEWRKGKDSFFPTRVALEASPEHLQHLYDQQSMVPGYKALLETGIHVLGTIDDVRKNLLLS